MLEDLRNWLESFWEEMGKELEKKPQYVETFRFMGKMLIAGLVFRAVLFLNPNTQIFQVWLAEISQNVLALFGHSFDIQGFLLVGEGNSYLISRDCLGWKSMAAFTALIYASTENLGKEFRVLFLGIIGLAVANVFRIVSTIILSEAGIISFDIVHTFLWRWGMTFLVLGIWYLWLTERLNPEAQGIFK